jgi:hypothetical protein
VTPLVSIVVVNHDYEQFVGAAIESALAQTHPRTEVVVVDDGSTDGSREVIARYADRVRVVHKSNGGQGSGYNEGFAHAQGDLVVFLDSDDLLVPEAAARVAAELGPGVAKVQFRLRVIDVDGAVLGDYPPPDVPLARGDVVPLLLRRGFYSTAVGSGNAYARSALAAVLPMPEERFVHAADGYLASAVPFEGEVRAVDECLGLYRRHARNDSAGSADAASFRKTLQYQLNEQEVVRHAARRHGIAVSGELVLRNAGHLERRLGSLVLDPGSHPLAADTRAQLALRGIAASLRDSDASLARRAVDCVWFALVGALPRRPARAVIAWKYERDARPAAIAVLARAFGRVVRRAGQ